MYPYGLIGNCQVSALVGKDGVLDWLCLPRPDSPPVFGRLLDNEGGHFSVEALGDFSTSQQYLPNTNVLVTTVSGEEGSRFTITDFCPRFYLFGRKHRPLSIFRIVEPLAGHPRIRVSFHPMSGWDKQSPRLVRGNSHVQCDIRGESLRLTTNMPLTYLLEKNPILLQEPRYFVLTWGSGFEDDLVRVSREFLQQTVSYWRTWVKHCAIPTLFQEEVIRSALALKLHCYEDTGAILAALTTSLPEDPGQERNWDYRYCWLRDAYFILSALRNLGHFEEMEQFLTFLLNLVHAEKKLHPVYRLDLSRPLPETTHPEWAGFHGSGPVRSGNQAAEQIQHDVYGEVILTLAPIFLDQRLLHLRTRDHEELLSRLMRLCEGNIAHPDAGIWEYRRRKQEHSFSNLMHWAGLDRIARIRKAGFLRTLRRDPERARSRAEKALRRAVKNGVLRNGPEDPALDASLLQLPLVHFPDTRLNRTTVTAIGRGLHVPSRRNGAGFLYRYRQTDDFGRPGSAFLACSFWLSQAWSTMGERGKAARILEKTIGAANHLGLMSEHFAPGARRQLGNFPQAYSHVGLINAAFAVSPPWAGVI